MNLLDNFLKKKGITDPSELTPEERTTFDGWKDVLSKEELTTSDVRDFCAAQVGLIEAKWSDLSLETSKKAELIPYHTVYRALLNAIDSPKHIREALEQQLLTLTK